MPSSRGLLNALPNLLWSAVFLLPVYWFWQGHFSLRWLMAAAVLSLPAYLAPHAGLRRLQLSPELYPYRRLGVPLVNRLTQDSACIRRIAGHAPPLRRDAASTGKIVRKTWERERFHLFLLLFFSVTTLDAVTLHAWGWSGYLLLSNVAFNLYPIWLQQFVRMRAERLHR